MECFVVDSMLSGEPKSKFNMFVIFLIVYYGASGPQNNKRLKWSKPKVSVKVLRRLQSTAVPRLRKQDWLKTNHDKKRH